jgi:flagellar biosynthesis/type III secretory pathway M-ring protein FliF/YscJ
MKKVKFTIASFMLLAFFSATVLTSCGGKKEEAAEATDSTEQAAEHPDGGEHPAGSEHPTDTTSKDTPA